MHALHALGRRLGAAAAIAAAASCVVYGLLALSPDPARMLAGFTAPQVAVDRARAELAPPFAVRYLRWAARAARGDLGRSRREEPVLPLVLSRVPTTALLAAAGCVAAAALAAPIAAWSARRPDRRHPVATLAALASAVPAYWLGIVAIVVAAVRFRWTPFGGGPLALVLPAATLAVPLLPLALAVLVPLAHAPAAARRTALAHAARRVAARVGWVIGATVVVEHVYGRPGLITLVTASVPTLDLAVVQGVLLVCVVAGALGAAAMPRAIEPWVAPRSRALRVAGALALGVLVAAAASAPVMAPYDPTWVRLSHTLVPPLAGGHLLGTDHLGRDTWSRLLWAARYSLAVGGLATALAALVGAAVGLAASGRGWGAAAARTLIGAGVAFPGVLLAVAVVLAAGSSQRTLVLGLAAALWPLCAVAVVGAVERLRPSVLASRAQGAGTAYVVRRHLLPAVAGALLGAAGVVAAEAVLAESFIGLLGLAVPRPLPTWGNMLAEARGFAPSAWWLVLAPGIAIAATALALRSLGDALRERLGW